MCPNTVLLKQKHTHTHNHFMALLDLVLDYPSKAATKGKTRKAKPIWIY